MSQLAIIDQAMSVLSTAEAALETNLERLNPVAQRALRAKAANQLSSLRDDIRDLERKRSRLTAGEAVLEPDPKAIAALSEAIAVLGKAASKGEKTEHLVAAIGPAVGAAKSLLAAV